MADPDIDDDSEPAGDEQDVLVEFRLSNRSLGVASERAELEQLGEQLEEALLAAGVGEYDGSELGAGTCTLFFAGPDAERLFAVLQPILRRHPLGRTAKGILQDGTGGPPIERRV